jgi:hypothetical protein
VGAVTGKISSSFSIFPKEIQFSSLNSPEIDPFFPFHFAGIEIDELELKYFEVLLKFWIKFLL